ncbi:MAG: O-antigen ligase family protein [Bacteroidia bacterium]|nr:O-antigen ligase family protein [Bacteroidia bacterium]
MTVFNHKHLNHPNLYLFGLALVAIGMPLSRFLMSLGIIIISANWVLEGNLKEKFRRYFINKSALLLTAVFFAYALGLFYSENLQYGFNNLVLKLPLLFCPLVIATSTPLNSKNFNRLLLVFIGAVLISSFLSLGIYLGAFDDVANNIRGISIFISNIRFSLMVTLSIFILAIFCIERSLTKLRILISLILILWLTAFLFLLGSFTGIVCFFVALVMLIFRFLYQTKGLRITILVGLITILISALGLNNFYRSNYKNENVSLSELPEKTANGNLYTHNFENIQKENGNLVWINICWKELLKEWKSVSNIGFEMQTKNGRKLKYVLVRYLTSKGINKDAYGISQLTDVDIHNIESGVTNYKYLDSNSLKYRLDQTVWSIHGYLSGANPEGQSVPQRIEFWKAAIGLIKSNTWFGVGTGDTKDSFKEYYRTTNSMLNEKWWYKSHNQFLTTTVALGVLGLFIFLLSLIYPFFTEPNTRQRLYLVFFIIAILSMIPEDGLEVQAGVMFFAYFNSLFLFGKSNINNDI